MDESLQYALSHGNCAEYRGSRVHFAPAAFACLLRLTAMFILCPEAVFFCFVGLLSSEVSEDI